MFRRWFTRPKPTVCHDCYPATGPRRVSVVTPLFDWAKFETHVAPLTASDIGDTLGENIDALLAEMDLLALPIATGTLRIGGAA